MEDLNEVVDRSLYGPNPPRGVRWIDLHWLGSRGLLVPETRGHLQELGPGGMLAIGTRSGLQDPGPRSLVICGTQRGVQGSGSAPGAGTQKPPQHVSLL
jgi:hypothetical protein